MKREPQGPQFVRYFGPVIDALKELGGSGRPAEVRDKVAERLSISEDDQNQTLGSGQSRFDNQVAWARFYLVRASLLDSSKRGVWSLTEKGRDSSLSHKEALVIFKEVRQQFSDSSEGLPKSFFDTPEIAVTEEEAPTPDADDHRMILLNVLRDLSPNGFERLCQRLLRESGFERVTVTGRSGDGGLDGIGILQMNPFVSFKVLFQCKRYSGAVGSSQVRDFRGAMMGRADKGIIITTGTFTADASKEAVRDGVPPIELVDGDKLTEMFESLELGLKPKKAYFVDYAFFEEFK
ncbi:MAG: restriction endonuclease [Caldilinea sp.]